MFTTSYRHIRTTLAIGTAATLVLAGCGNTQDAGQSMASEVTFTDQWVNASDTDMAALFGTVTNNSETEARLVSGSSSAAATIEVHEVVAEGGTNVMRPKDGGIVIPAGQSHELAPGGDHLMLMDLTAPLLPGADVTVTVTFGDGSAMDVTAQVRDFPGADEEYQPSDESTSPHGHG